MIRDLVEGDLPSFTEWPLSIDDLLREDRLRLEWTREAEVYAATDEDDASD